MERNLQKADHLQNTTQLERAKTIKVGNIRWPPDKPNEAIGGVPAQKLAQRHNASIEDLRKSLLTIERTKFPSSHSQSQFMTAAKIAAAQQELVQKIGPRVPYDNLPQERNLQEETPTRKPLLDPAPKLAEKHGPSDSPHRPPIIQEAEDSNSLNGELQHDNNLLEYSHFPCLTYQEAPWTLAVRKELFYNREKSSKAAIDLIYQQILSDSRGKRHIRFRQKDQRRLESLIASAKVPDMDTGHVKRAEVVDFVKESCPFYFMKVFPLSKKSEDIEFIGVSQKQITLGKVSVATDNEPCLQAIHIYPFHVIQDMNCKENSLALVTRNQSLVLQCAYAENIIKLTKKLSLGGTRPKNHSNSQGNAKLVKERSMEKKPEQVSKMETSLKDHQKESITRPASTNICEIKSPTRRTTTEKQQLLSVESERTQMDTRHSMADFAEYFHKKDETTEKQGFPNPFKLVASKAVSLPDVTKLRKKTSQLKWAASPLKQPILTFKDVKMARLAINCHIYIMSFMGDYAVGKHIRHKDLVINVLKAGMEYKQLQDEIYCQLIMQTNQNKSTNRQSCELGWRLFSVISAFFPCTDMLQPYVIKYLQNCTNPKLGSYDHASLASMCLQVGKNSLFDRT